ncbi:MAG: divergent polysaccharide deacetylase family protein [Candidatus Omnitrophica bacterium]|nr:divergent polysaccharide deacetylase family protein [Candidatus Omnitrophota bacterium]
MKKQKLAIIIISCLLAIETVLLLWVWLGRAKVIKKPPKAIRGKIAIVLDDWGYNLNNLATLEEIGSPLTLSILPNLPFSRKIAEAAHSRGFEVILHLPMQPKENVRLERNTILVSMDDKVIGSIVNQDLDDIIYAKGASNHMGSLATTDIRVMRTVFKELKLRHIYFLDSFVSYSIVSPLLAHEMKLKTARRDVFLDNSEDPAYIRQQIYKLKLRALGKGEAIGIGHDKKNTLEVLKEMMPILEKEGYKFVFVSELVK